jgi:hypothetical protein
MILRVRTGLPVAVSRDDFPNDLHAREKGHEKALFLQALIPKPYPPCQIVTQRSREGAFAKSYARAYAKRAQGLSRNSCTRAYGEARRSFRTALSRAREKQAEAIAKGGENYTKKDCF